MPPSPADPRFCTACGAALAPRARFCHRCGAGDGPGAAVSRSWILSGVAVALSVVAIAVLLSRPRQPALTIGPAAAAFGGPAPDISTLTPRERFDRLYDRAIALSARGDTAGLLRFTDHALSAYGQLADPDPDARYHAGVLYLGIGRYASALALADSILAAEPEHLLGHLLRGSVAEVQGDKASLARAGRDFLDAWRQAADRPRAEYLDHQAALAEFRRAAEASP